MKITIGRVVHYVLSEADAAAIEGTRREFTSMMGAHVHRGNTASAGDIFPAMAVSVFSEGDDPPVNFQVFLDGNDTYWATSRHESPDAFPGNWHWPQISK